MLKWYHPTRPLRSSAFPSLVPNKHKTIKNGRRLCDTAKAVLWKNLPTDLRGEQSLQTFKKHLKNYLFLTICILIFLKTTYSFLKVFLKK